jgi:hypothetical protein
MRVHLDAPRTDFHAVSTLSAAETTAKRRDDGGQRRTTKELRRRCPPHRRWHESIKSQGWVKCWVVGYKAHAWALAVVGDTLVKGKGNNGRLTAKDQATMGSVYTTTRTNEISETLIWIHGLRSFFPASSIVRRSSFP